MKEEEKNILWITVNSFSTFTHASHSVELNYGRDFDCVLLYGYESIRAIIIIIIFTYNHVHAERVLYM